MAGRFLMDKLWKAEQLESVVCDNCGSSRSDALVARPDGLSVVRCSVCGLCFLNPRPNAASLHLLYDEKYFSSANSSRGIGYAAYGDETSRQTMQDASQMRLDLVRELVPGLRLAQSLELGCATGEFCEVLRRAGATCILGLDISEFAISTARSRYSGIVFEQGSVESFSTAFCFDAIFAFEIIEHLPSPRSFLQKVGQLLAPGGHVVLTTPNVRCASTVGKSRWSGFNTSFEHLYFFDTDTLKRCGQEAGLEVVDWLTGGGDGVWDDQPLSGRHWRRLVRSGLKAAGLLNTVNAFRRRLSPPRLHYDRSPDHHNLALAFRR